LKASFSAARTRFVRHILPLHEKNGADDARIGRSTVRLMSSRTKNRSTIPASVFSIRFSRSFAPVAAHGCDSKANPVINQGLRSV
jgi:hypothetical protein